MNVTVWDRIERDDRGDSSRARRPGRPGSRGVAALVAPPLSACQGHPSGGLRPALTRCLLTPRAGCAVRRSRVDCVNPAQTGLARAGVWPEAAWLRLCPHSTNWCTASTRGDHVRSRALGGAVGKVRHRTLSDLTPRPTAAVRPENDHPARESVDKNEHSPAGRAARGRGGARQSRPRRAGHAAGGETRPEATDAARAPRGRRRDAAGGETRQEPARPEARRGGRRAARPRRDAAGRRDAAEMRGAAEARRGRDAPRGLRPGAARRRAGRSGDRRRGMTRAAAATLGISLDSCESRCSR